MKLMCKLFGCKAYGAESEVKVEEGILTVTNYCCRCGRKHILTIHKGKLLRVAVEND